MEAQETSTICEGKKIQELAGYKKLEDPRKIHGESLPRVGDSDELKNFCPENCGNVEDRDDSTGEKDEVAENSQCSIPSAPAEVCELPLDSWTGLSKVTGTRPTVGNYTVARYSPDEWRKAQEELLRDSKYRIREAKNHEFKTKLLESEIFSQIDKQQLDNSLRLRARAGALFHWKTELNFLRDEVETEISKIQAEIRRLSNCFQAVEMIKNMDKDIQRARKSRGPPDLVHDVLAEEIIKELKLCEDILNLYTRCIDETKMQLEELKNAKERVELDWSDKSAAYDADTTCLGLKNNSEELQWKPGSVQLPPDQSSPEGHTSFVQGSVIYGKTAINRSEVLRANMREATTTCSNDLRKQAGAVEIALTDQTARLTNTIRSLETSLKSCLKRISDNEILINNTNSAIRGVDGPLKVVQTRLALRLTRENIENCRDASQTGLIDEVKNISEGATALSGQVKAAQDFTSSLIELRKKLESDILVKKNSLWIDRERCRIIRSYYPSIKTLSGY